MMELYVDGKVAKVVFGSPMVLHIGAWFFKCYSVNLGICLDNHLDLRY